jgi:hypothetical protein
MSKKQADVLNAASRRKEQSLDRITEVAVELYEQGKISAERLKWIKERISRGSYYSHEAFVDTLQAALDYRGRSLSGLK